MLKKNMDSSCDVIIRNCMFEEGKPHQSFFSSLFYSFFVSGRFHLSVCRSCCRSWTLAPFESPVGLKGAHQTQPCFLDIHATGKLHRPRPKNRNRLTSQMGNFHFSISISTLHVLLGSRLDKTPLLLLDCETNLSL